MGDVVSMEEARERRRLEYEAGVRRDRRDNLPAPWIRPWSDPNSDPLGDMHRMAKAYGVGRLLDECIAHHPAGSALDADGPWNG